MLRRLASLLTFLALVLTAASAQEGQAIVHQRVGGPEPNKKGKAISPKDMALAKSILDTAEAESAKFEPSSKSFLCWQAARGVQKIDRAAAREQLLRCFTASQDIDTKDDFKQQLQGWIVRELLAYGPATAEELMPQVEGEARSMVRTALIRNYTDKKLFDKAIALISGVQPGEERFPYEAVAQLMQQLPEDLSGEKRSLFTQALSDYKQRSGSDRGFSTDDMGTMVVRFYREMPKETVLEAIDTLLDRAKQKDNDSKPPQLVVSSNAGTAAFRTRYEWRLFQVLPALESLDPSRAKELLKQNQQTKDLITKYPQGLASMSPRYSGAPQPQPEAPGDNGGPQSGKPPQDRLSFRMGDQGNANEQGGAMEMGRAMRQKSDDIVKDAEKNPRQAIAQAMSLSAPQGPVYEDFRMEALDGIAGSLREKSPQFSKSATEEMVKLSDGLDPDHQVRYLSRAAKHYLDLSEKEAAQKTMAKGIGVCKKLYEKDTNADDPNQAIRPFWPSADCMRSFVNLAGKISNDAALETAKEIDDPEILLFERINIANVALGVPRGMSIVRTKSKKDDNWSMDSDDDGPGS